MAAEPLYLAIDQGTHASRAVVLDARGGVVATGSCDLGLSRPQPDWAEQDGEEMVDSVLAAASRALAGVGRSPAPSGRGRTRQPARELRLLGSARWPGHYPRVQLAGPPRPRLASAVRTAGRGGAPENRTLPVRALRRQQAALGARKPAGGSRSPRGGKPVLGAPGELPRFPAHLGACDVRRSAMRGENAVVESARATGTRHCSPSSACPRATCPGACPRAILSETIRIGDVAVPLVAVNGDQSAAVFAFGAPDEECAYVNIGTSAFVQRAVSTPPSYAPRSLTGIILEDENRTVYSVEGNVNGAGTALEWLGSELGILDAVSRLPEWLEKPGEPPLFLNGIAGLGGPFWQPDFSSRFVGEGEPWQQAVAVVESMAFLLQANIDEIAKHVPPARRIRASGGVSRFDGLCRRIASVSGLPVLRRDDAEATARGIGYLAAGMPARWNDAASEEVFEPLPDEAIRRRYARWRGLMREATGV
ncbi:MAG: hypothetical protein IPH30_17090 [Betaproteobacteria bacterium]|nr:hypothetical protein [Betaproteobacteria bacterium]